MTGATSAPSDPGTHPHTGQCPDGTGAHSGEHDPERYAQLVLQGRPGRGDRGVLRHGGRMAQATVATGASLRSVSVREAAYRTLRVEGSATVWAARADSEVIAEGSAEVGRISGCTSSSVLLALHMAR